MSNFTHLDEAGNPHMVNVGEKPATKRMARARCIVELGDEIMDQLENSEIHTKKGPVFQTAILAGIMASKKTGELIPLCHPLGLDNCEVQIQVDENRAVATPALMALFSIVTL